MLNYRHVVAALMGVIGFVSLAVAQTTVRLSATPAANTVTAGNTVTYTINIARTNYPPPTARSGAR